MHLIIRYHQPLDDSAEGTFPPEQDWLPTWRIDGPDEPDVDQARATTVSLEGETRLPILKHGEPLHPGEVYLDLRNPAQGPFRALDGQSTGEGNAYVAQGNLTPAFWDRLVRVCARAGALVIDADRAGTGVDVTIVMEPASTSVSR
ncbi:hypothetical protein BH23CHL5_BH23CHL5_02570 [soil metagenome]